MNLEPKGWLEKSKKLVKNIEVDPTKSSVVFSESDNREYHNIIDDPQDQMFLSRLLKGILPVSDVVFEADSKEFYSYEMPVESISPADTKIQHEANLNADLLLLRFIFGDADHNPSSGLNVQLGERAHALYDFDMFAKNFWHRMNQKEMESQIEGLYPRELQALQAKVGALKERVLGDAGREFIDAILADMEKTGAGRPRILSGEFRHRKDEDTIRSFQEQLRKKIGEVDFVLSKHSR